MAPATITRRALAGVAAALIAVLVLAAEGVASPSVAAHCRTAVFIDPVFGTTVRRCVGPTHPDRVAPQRNPEFGTVPQRGGASPGFTTGNSGPFTTGPLGPFTTGAGSTLPNPPPAGIAVPDRRGGAGR